MEGAGQGRGGIPWEQRRQCGVALRPRDGEGSDERKSGENKSPASWSARGDDKRGEERRGGRWRGGCLISDVLFILYYSCGFVFTRGSNVDNGPQIIAHSFCNFFFFVKK